MFAHRIIEWQRRAGRHGLPWQGGRDPYRIWVSEIMLQQTQVAAVIPYFERFIARFPDVDTLAAAELEEVLRLWSGLGYYTRARNLHACAVRIVREHGGRFPPSAARIAELPGIGRSTAAAIAAFAFGERVAILDGNVRRVLCRVFGVEGYPAQPAVERILWSIAERELPEAGIEAYTQGLMDLGATLCTRSRPECARCPVGDLCVATRDDRVAELPAPRPRKALATREVRMLVLRRGNEVLLERRPPSGVWGGLWSLPEMPAGGTGNVGESRFFPPDPTDVREHAARQGLRVDSVETLPGFVHVFTHFRLRVTPILVDVTPIGVAQASATVWLPLSDAGEAALPTPVKSLLVSLASRGPGVSGPECAGDGPRRARVVRRGRSAP